MFADHFVSTHQQVGDFRAVTVGGRVQKNGGNVASHFLTTDGRVIHSVTGPVSADVLIEEANWALDLYEKSKERRGNEQLQFVSWSHQQASLSPVSGQDQRVHQLLSQYPLPPLQSVYKEIFEKILGQRVSKAGPRLAQASQTLEFAEKTGRPILFVLHKQGEWFDFKPGSYDALTRQIMAHYAVVVMPLKEAPALSQLTNQPPYEASSSARPLFVIANSDCKQLDSVAGWNHYQLAHAMAEGWIDSLERKPSSLRSLVRATTLLKKLDPALSKRTIELTVRVQKEAKAAREAKRAAENHLAAK